MHKPVLICKSGNLLDLNHYDDTPLSPQLRQVLEPELTYTHKQKLYGQQRFDSPDGRPRDFAFHQVKLYRYDGQNRLICGAGFLQRITDKLSALTSVHLHDWAPPSPRPDRYFQDWDLVMEHFHDQFRPKQEECLMAMATNDCGVIHACTGFGKTIMQVMNCLLFSRAKIHLVVPGADLVQKAVAVLSRYLPNIGQVGAGKKTRGRVTVFSADSLHLSDGDADILLADEGHRLAAPTYAEPLARYQNSKNFMFSATPGGRFDGADLQLESLFGQTIFHISYPEAVELGLVVPIRVEWLNVQMTTNPCGTRKDVARERHGIWRNTTRNQVIATKAHSYADDVQVLILVKTLEHALYLRRCLPDFELCYSEGALEPEEIVSYQRRGLFGEDEEVVTAKKRLQMRQDFETGALKKVIATGVWATGVDFVNLQVLIRGDAMMSEIADTQIPGRVCRTNENDKSVGVLVDMIDQFDEGFRRKAMARSNHYKSNGWEQVKPKRQALAG